MVAPRAGARGVYRRFSCREDSDRNRQALRCDRDRVRSMLCSGSCKWSLVRTIILTGCRGGRFNVQVCILRRLVRLVRYACVRPRLCNPAYILAINPALKHSITSSARPDLTASTRISMLRDSRVVQSSYVATVNPFLDSRHSHSAFVLSSASQSFTSPCTLI
jgi:hypothetical protein